MSFGFDGGSRPGNPGGNWSGMLKGGGGSGGVDGDGDGNGVRDGG